MPAGAESGVFHGTHQVLQTSGWNVGVGGDVGHLLEAMELQFAGGEYAPSNNIRRFRFHFPARQCIRINLPDFQVKIDAIEQRATDAISVSLQISGGTSANPIASKKSARTPLCRSFATTPRMSQTTIKALSRKS